jgi:integrative and conjugative element protein (TIGR02256 family)
MSYILVLAKSVLRAIEEQCLEHHATETGGVLQGRLVGREFVVPFMIPAGPHATKTPVHFAPDSDWQQVILDFLFARFGADYVGDWHRHPRSFDRPSAHDLRTARTIVRTWKSPVALFPIAVIEGGRVRLRAYLMRRDTLQFEDVAIEVADDNDPRMIAVLTGRDASNQGVLRVQADDAGREPRASDRGGIIRRAAAALRALSARRSAAADSQPKA